MRTAMVALFVVITAVIGTAAQQNASSELNRQDGIPVREDTDSALPIAFFSDQNGVIFVGEVLR